jgi:hypothetical protein
MLKMMKKFTVKHINNSNRLQIVRKSLLTRQILIEDIFFWVLKEKEIIRRLLWLEKSIHKQLNP